MNYRSLLNPNPQPGIGAATPFPTAGYAVLLPARMSLNQFGGPALPENAARIDLLSQPQTVSSDVAYFLLKATSDSTVLVLDDRRLKNVVIVGSRIEYDGGPAILENVTFVNCTFAMKSMQRTQNLAIAMFAPDPATTFSGE